MVKRDLPISSWNDYLHLSNNRDGSSKLLMYHKSKDSHHCSTSVVQLNSTLGKLGLLIEGVPSEVKSSVTEVTRELSLSGNILHDEKLKASYECNDLKKSTLGDSLNSSPAVGDGVEGVSGVVNISGKVDTSTVDDVSEESKLANTSVLDLNITEAVETLLVSIIEKSKRIEESKRRLNSELSLECVKSGGGLSYLGRCKCSSRRKEGGEDKLHFDCCKLYIVRISKWKTCFKMIMIKRAKRLSFILNCSDWTTEIIFINVAAICSRCSRFVYF
jgi:hypothetical protein